MRMRSRAVIVRCVWGLAAVAFLIAACSNSPVENITPEQPAPGKELNATPYLGSEPFVSATGAATAIVVPSERIFDTVDRYYELDIESETWIEYTLDAPSQITGITRSEDAVTLAGVTCEGIESGAECGEISGSRFETIEIDIGTHATTRRPIGNIVDDPTAVAIHGVAARGAPATTFLVLRLSESRWGVLDKAGNLIDGGPAPTTNIVCGDGTGTVVTLDDTKDGSRLTVGIETQLFTATANTVEQESEPRLADTNPDPERGGSQTNRTRCTDTGEPIVVDTVGVGVIKPASGNYQRLADRPPGNSPHQVVGAEASALFALSSDHVLARLDGTAWTTIDDFESFGDPPDESISFETGIPDFPVRRLARVGDTIIMISSSGGQAGPTSNLVVVS